ncbi:serine/threonine-protein kinase [Streptomyces sp. NPDC088124]|uniref:serine/threonine-protein kinase n=1 Tax=Streptomyces sp. NPDC088124 TaxID=3154654 RepID=UPI003449C3D8
MPPLRNTGSAPEAERPEYAGRYLLESALGSGGMGEVHLATSASGLRLAVKVIHANHASDPEFRARFQQEVAAARRVSGAFTAPVVDADPEAGRPWMATLFIDGPTLSERVKRNGPLGTEDLFRLGAGLAEGLRDIHRAGVVHRDLKPSNVLLASDGPKVIDFGISRPADSDLRTETGKLIGTPPFMAPEQFQRPREVGPAADVFAMGAVLVHAATGRGPFDSDSPYIVAYQVVHDEPDLTGVPERIVPVIRGCLAKDPADRPTPDEVMGALRTSRSVPGGVVPSTAYDLRGPYGASALVPAQRGPDPVESAGPDAGSGRGPGGGAGSGPGSVPTNHARGTGAVRSLSSIPSASPSASPSSPAPSPSPSPAPSSSPARSPRRVRTVVGAVALVAVACAGFFGVRAMGDGAPARTDAEPSRTFEPWETTLGDGPGQVPVCAAGTTAVYCAGPGGTTTRLDPLDGRPAWSVKGAAGAKGAKGAEAVDAGSDADAAPVLSGGLLHVVAHGAGGEKRLAALDPASGAERWGVDVSSYATVRHSGGSVLLVSYDGRVRSLDSATGDERWTERLGGTGTVWTAASGTDGALFAATPSGDGSATEVRSIDPATGAVRWEERLTGGLAPVGASDDALFLLANDVDGFTEAVVRLDASSRTERRVPLGAPVDQAQATAVGDTVYVIGYSGSLLAVDTGGKAAGAKTAGAKGSGARAGGVRWRLETSVTRASRPAATEERVYLSAGDGRLLAVDARRGVLLGQTKPRMAEGPDTLVPTLPAPVLGPGSETGTGSGSRGTTVFGSAPDGSVFAVAGRDPASW